MATDPKEKSGLLAIQLALMALKYPTNTSGIYNDVYVNALRNFQRDNGLDIDGIPGPMTRKKLAEKLGKPIN